MSETLPRLSLRSIELTPAMAFQTWRATLPQYEISLPDGDLDAFRMDVSAWLLDPLVFTAGTTTAARLDRKAELLKDGYDHYVFVLFVKGRLQGEVEGRRFAFGDGEVCLLDVACPFWVEATDSAYIMVNVPRETLRKLLPVVPDLRGRVLRAAGARLLADHLQALARYLPMMGRSEALRMSQATLTLMAASLGELTDRPLPAEPPLAPAIRLRVERYVERNLGSADLAPDAIARDLEIARSTLYRAFTPLGGVSAYVQGRRLDAARALLFHPEEHRPIGEIGQTLGFESAATFSKAFHRRFGCSPREARLNGTTRVTSGKALFDSWRDVLERPH